MITLLLYRDCDPLLLQPCGNLYHTLKITPTCLKYWLQWVRLKSPATRLFAQTLVPTQNKEHTKDVHIMRLCILNIYVWIRMTIPRYNGVTWVSRRLRSPTNRLFVQQFVRANIKRNMKNPYHWPFMRGIYRWQVDAPRKGPLSGLWVMWKAFSCHDVFMVKRVQGRGSTLHVVSPPN